MNYREVYKIMCRHAADHLNSLDAYDEFDDADHDRVAKALLSIQQQLWKKAEIKISSRHPHPDWYHEMWAKDYRE